MLKIFLIIVKKLLDILLKKKLTCLTIFVNIFNIFFFLFLLQLLINNYI